MKGQVTKTVQYRYRGGRWDSDQSPSTSVVGGMMPVMPNSAEPL